MKKLFICFVCLLMTSCMTFGAFDEISQEYFSNMSDNELIFFLKFQTCSPAMNEKTGEIIHGKARNGGCYYSYSDMVNSLPVQYHCVVPMKTALAYGSTAHDVYDYSKSNPEVASQRYSQNIEIRKIMQDYCIMVRVK